MTFLTIAFVAVMVIFRNGRCLIEIEQLIVLINAMKLIMGHNTRDESFPKILSPANKSRLFHTLIGFTQRCFSSSSLFLKVDLKQK